MQENKHETEEWWRVIHSLSELVTFGYEHIEFDEEYIRIALVEKGYSSAAIEVAMDWIEMASNSGNLNDIFSMFQQSSNSKRIANPLEKVSIPQRVWRQFEEIRDRGIIGPDFAERVLEGVRALDTRDWEDEDIKIFFKEIIMSTMPHVSDKTIEKILEKKPVSELYS